MERGVVMFQNEYDGDYDYQAYDQTTSIEDCCECRRSSCECDCDCHCEIGPTGLMGVQGPRGPQGPRGLQGQQGREGLQGPRGPQGVTGLQGEPGIQGPTGPTGPRGYQGLSGKTGATGATGAQGPQGPQGNTGPAGQDAEIVSFASASLQSYTAKELCPQDALVFDISNIQQGFTVSDDYCSLCAMQQGTYLVQYGCLVDNTPCIGDAIALEVNHTTVIEESRMPVLGQSYIRGTIILTLHANDCISLVSDSMDALTLCGINNTINAYLIIYQINA